MISDMIDRVNVERRRSNSKFKFKLEEKRMVVLASDLPPAGWAVLPAEDTQLETPLAEHVAADGRDQP